MKKTFTFLILIFCAVLLCSCSDTDTLFQTMFDTGSGKASSIVNGGNEREYTSSVVMFNDYASPRAAIGISSSIDVENLTGIGNVETLNLPFLTYRISGDIKTGDILNVNNVLTEADLDNFNKESLLNGKFANKNIVAIAESDSKFFIMNTGTINISKVTKFRVKGGFSGTAYVINLDATPKIAEEQVTISGNFISRIAPITNWLLYLQAEESNKIAGN